MKKKTVALITSVAAVMLLSITVNAEDNTADGAYVAQLGSGDKYTSLQAAVDAAAANDTVTLLGDIHLDESVEVASDDDLTIDLNGYTITVTKDEAAGRSLYAINNYGDCTINDTSADKTGTIISRGTMNYNLMTIKGGTIDSCDSNGGGACVWNEGVLYINGGVLKVSGEAKDNSSAALVNNAVPEGEVYITGGSFESPRTSFFSSGYMEITGVELSVSTQYWNAVKTYGGSYTELNDVKINASLGGGLEAAGGDIVLNDCEIIQSNYFDHNSSCGAVSSGGTLEINGGTYNSDNYGFYVFNSGGTININDCNLKTGRNALKADNTSNGWGSNINVYGGNVDGTLGIGSEAELNVYGGTYTVDVSDYLAEGTAYKADGNQYVVISDKNKATEDGTYKTPVKDNNKYDQMTLVRAEIKGTIVASDIGFNIKFNDEEPFTYNYKGSTKLTDATVMLGLIITDIPEDDVVTVTID